MHIPGVLTGSMIFKLSKYTDYHAITNHFYPRPLLIPEIDLYTLRKVQGAPFYRNLCIVS